VRKGGAKAANPATNSPASISTELPRCGVSPQPHRSGSAAPADHGVPELRGWLGGVDTGGSCVRIVGRPAGIAGGCEVDPVAHVTGDAHDLVGCVGAGRATRRFTTVHGPVPDTAMRRRPRWWHRWDFSPAQQGSDRVAQIHARRCWRDRDIAEAHRSAIARFVDWLRNRVGPVRTGVRGAR